MRAHATAPLVFAAALLASGCGREEPPPPPLKPFIYTAPPKPRATRVPKDTFEWVRMAQDLQADIEALQARLTKTQAIYQQNSFDGFLEMDLAGLNVEHLASLWHFADKGYFTVEREILLKLLEDRIANSTAAGPPLNIADRAKNLAQFYEQRVRDLSTAVEMYEKTQKGEFHLPQVLNDEQLEVLRGLVREKLAGAREQCRQLDSKIASLQAGLH